jgi:D-alanyl-D-alanine-carboxypeptidase/D-alanyl-D-alanine-endopeptidase
MIVEPKREQLEALVAPYLKIQPAGLGFAIGYASRSFAKIFYAGGIHNQAGTKVDLDEHTPFEIASISKTFTATLYALLIPESARKRKLEYYIAKHWLPIDRALAGIDLQSLVNYTSGLPQDYDERGAEIASPRFPPRPYSMTGMLNFLNTWPPKVSPGYSYSNLAFAIMSAVIASEKVKGRPSVDVFVGEMFEHLFKPLGIAATFFDEAPIDKLPLGFHYQYWPSKAYTEKQPGHPFYPAYFGAHGIVATPNDMLKWLKFNMGLTDNPRLNSLLPILQRPSTDIRANEDQIGLGWFINEENRNWVESISKDGELEGFSSYIAFVPSNEPGKKPSEAGAFVLVNADGIRIGKGNDESALPVALTNAVLRIMLRKPTGADASA